MKMQRLCLLVIFAVGCAQTIQYVKTNPTTGKRILWPRRFTPESRPAVRGDVLPAMQAALNEYLSTRLKNPDAWEGRCEDTGRAMELSYMVDEDQHLVFVHIDEAPEKHCPAGEPFTIRDVDGGIAIVVPRPFAPVVVDNVYLFAVTFDGRVLDAFMPSESESLHPYVDDGFTPSWGLPSPDGGARDGGMSDRAKDFLPDDRSKAGRPILPSDRQVQPDAGPEP